MSKEEYQRQVVKIGYHGEWAPTRFRGRELFSSTNKDSYRNRERYHVWKLFEIPSRGFRVLDFFIDETDNRQNIQLSQEMCGGEVAFYYPKLAKDAIEEDILTEEDITLDIEHREMLDRLREMDVELDALEVTDPGHIYHDEGLLTRKRQLEERIYDFRRRENATRNYRVEKQSKEGKS